MILEMQKQMLQAAAQRSIEHPGSIQSIFFVALDMGDEDTIRYIYKHYFTAQYFTQENMQFIQAVFDEEAAEQATTH